MMDGMAIPSPAQLCGEGGSHQLTIPQLGKWTEFSTRIASLESNLTGPMMKDVKQGLDELHAMQRSCAESVRKAMIICLVKRHPSLTSLVGYFLFKDGEKYQIDPAENDQVLGELGQLDIKNSMVFSRVLGCKYGPILESFVHHMHNFFHLLPGMSVLLPKIKKNQTCQMQDLLHGTTFAKYFQALVNLKAFWEAEQFDIRLGLDSDDDDSSLVLNVDRFDQAVQHLIQYVGFQLATCLLPMKDFLSGILHLDVSVAEFLTKANLPKVAPSIILDTQKVRKLFFDDKPKADVTCEAFGPGRFCVFDLCHVAEMVQPAYQVAQILSEAKDADKSLWCELLEAANAKADLKSIHCTLLQKVLQLQPQLLQTFKAGYL